MSLSNFQVFNDYGYRAFVNTIQQKIDLWNASTNGALILESMAFSGDVYEKAAFENLASLVGDRDPWLFYLHRLQRSIRCSVHEASKACMMNHQELDVDSHEVLIGVSIIKIG